MSIRPPPGCPGSRMVIRPEEPGDRPAILDLLRAAFPGPEEALLVDRLAADGDVVLSLVAEDAQADPPLIGHILFSPMAAPFRALGLGPVAVDGRHRRRGLAAALIREGLRRVEAQGWQAVFVLGDPAYYSRFGFAAEAAAGFVSPYAGPYFMALPLGAERLPAATGQVDYAPAFAALG